MLNREELIPLIIEYGATYSIKVFFALIIFFIGRKLARMLSNLAKDLMAKNDVDIALRGFVGSLLYWAIFLMFCVAALAQLGVQTASLVAMLGAAGLAIGLALQGSLSNFAAGVLIVLFKPFRIDDFVEVAGEAGKVANIQILTTELRTPDNKQVIIPNARVMDGNIINYSSTGKRRVDLVFGISYNDDIQQAKDCILDEIKKDKRILQDKEPQIALMELADSSMNFVVRPWCKSEDYWDVYTDLNEAIKNRFDKEGISIPFPTSQVAITRS
jgi:small conductance mechanosensitive channel